MKGRLVKRYHTPGTAPGTVAPPAPSAAGMASLSLLSYAADHVTERTAATLPDLEIAPREEEKAWLRVVGHSGDVLQAVATRFGVHPLVIEDVVNLGQRPKLEDYGDYLFIVVDALRFGEGGVMEEEQLSILVFEHLLITIQERQSTIFAPVEERLRSRRGKMGGMGVDYLAYALVDAAVDHYFPVLERLGEHLEDVEDRLLDRPDHESLEELHGIKRNLLRLRKAAWPLREMVGAFTRSDSHLVREGTRVWLRDVYDHTVQIIDIIETFRDLTTELVDLYLSSVSNRMNEVMKVLTVIATIFIPLTFIVGLYGMNFNTQVSPYNMPELNWRFGYGMVWAVMIGTVASMLWMFKRRGWF